MPNENTQTEIQERLARLETGLETGMQNFNKSLSRIEAKLDMWPDHFVPRNEINEMFRARDKDMDDLEKTITDFIQNQQANQRSLKTTWPTWVSAGITFMMFLITVYTLAQTS